MCETDVCFLYIQIIGANVWFPKIHESPPDVDFETSRSPAKSESWNNPNLHCCAVFLFDEYDCESVSCALCYVHWTMSEEWSQLQCACPWIQITLKITYMYLIVFKTVNSVHASRVASQVLRFHGSHIRAWLKPWKRLATVHEQVLLLTYRGHEHQDMRRKQNFSWWAIENRLVETHQRTEHNDRTTKRPTSPTSFHVFGQECDWCCARAPGKLPRYARAQDRVYSWVARGTNLHNKFRDPPETHGVSETVMWFLTPTGISVALRLISNVRCSALLCIHAYFFMSCTAVANFPEGVAKLNARGFMCSPAIREVVARVVQIVL